MIDLAGVAALYAARGHEAYGEAVSQSDHAVQCAGLAAAEGAGPALVAAALLHDLGHLLAGGDDADHAATGAAALAAVFGPAVAGPAALHVAAKRWLCAVEPGYAAALSPASLQSLARQGGAFDFAAAVRLRRWDDRAKARDAAGRAFADYLPLLAALTESRR